MSLIGEKPASSAGVSNHEVASAIFETRGKSALLRMRGRLVEAIRKRKHPCPGHP